MSCLDGLFALGRSSASGAPGSKLRRLPRKTAAELQLLAVLAPVVVSNVSASPPQEIFASDAFTGFGAFCATNVDPDLGLLLWLAADFKGQSVLLEHAP